MRARASTNRKINLWLKFFIFFFLSHRTANCSALISACPENNVGHASPAQADACAIGDLGDILSLWKKKKGFFFTDWEKENSITSVAKKYLQEELTQYPEIGPSDRRWGDGWGNRFSHHVQTADDEIPSFDLNRETDGKKLKRDLSKVKKSLINFKRRVVWLRQLHRHWWSLYYPIGLGWAEPDKEWPQKSTSFSPFLHPWNWSLFWV